MEKKFVRKMGWNLIAENDYLLAQNHADFLNQMLGLSLGAWQKSSREHNDQRIWMVFFDSKERNGWYNYFLSDDECCQVNVKHATKWGGEDIRESLKQERVVFETQDRGCFKRRYIFRGIFEYEEEKSDPLNRVYFKKIADEFEFHIEG